ncbi:hypothetical protein BH09PAT3_BH09PAT3_7130 [soil metagenome]
MIFKDITNKIHKAATDYKEGQELKKATEEARKQSILDGKIEPVQVLVNLEQDEKAYADFGAKRMAVIDSIIEKTVGKSKKKGVITRAVVGGVLLGPLGAVGGAATAGSKNNSTTTQETVSKLQVIDTGSLIFTNKRIVFVGNNVLSLTYDKLIAVNFDKTMSGMKLNLKYEGMLKGEHFIVGGEKAKDTELYFKGITQKLLLKETTDAIETIEPTTQVVQPVLRTPKIQ